MKTVLLALLLAVASLPVLGQQPAALVEGVQMPAWLERGGRKTPLVPGVELRAGDRITTGDGSRVLMKLAEGSVVKLGENGTLRIAEIQPGKDVFRAALEVLEGAFRFTTDIVSKARKREVSVSVERVTIGIRGTDFWGRSRAARQIVCLIEGAIQVGAPGEPAVTMNQPRQFYQRDKGKTLPVGLVEAAQLQQWSQETEIAAGQGAARAGGRFNAELLNSADPKAARELRERLREAGYAAELVQRKAGGKLTHVVRIRQLPSREEAQALAARLKGKFGG
jgi:hypothetical protein